ncbi:MAG: tetratricopeptide repeat protein [Myxococcota bacterium]
MTSSYALQVAVSFHGEVVEERSLRFGESGQLGNSSLIAVPVPEGHDHLARVMWTSPRMVVVQTVTGELHEVTPEEDLTLEVGPVSLKLYLAPQFPIRRSNRVSSVASLAWFCVVLMVTLIFVQAEWAFREVCFIGEQLLRQEVCVQPVALNENGHPFTAEYLARLLRKDYDGEDVGVIEHIDNIDRPDVGAEIEDNHVYLPAGDKGPITKMGGAEETAPTPVRNTDEEDIVVPKKKVEEKAPLVVEEAEVLDDPVEVVEAEAGEDEGLEDVPTEDAEEALDVAAEEEEGWGLPSWYDEKDAAFEEFVLEYNLQYVRDRLRIDPNDIDALSQLSYFQYLAQEYDDAVDTYNKIIEQIPESSMGYNNKALVYKRRGDYQKEEALYRIALSLEPMDAIAMNNLAVNLSHQGRFEEALAIMEQLEQIDPGDAYADLHRSKIYAEMGEEDQALTFLRKALQGFATMDTLHRIEFRQDIRLDPSFAKLRETRRFRSILVEFFGKDTPLSEE